MKHDKTITHYIALHLQEHLNQQCAFVNITGHQLACFVFLTILRFEMLSEVFAFRKTQFLTLLHITVQ